MVPVKPAFYINVDSIYSKDYSIDEQLEAAHRFLPNTKFIYFIDFCQAGCPISDRKGLVACLTYIEQHSPSHLVVLNRNTLLCDVIDQFYIVNKCFNNDTKILVLENELRIEAFIANPGAYEVIFIA